MFIDTGPREGPVLLYLHGGLPEYFLTERYPTGLEEVFTVVWWEQRGTGLSADPAILPGSITAEQLIADTLAVTDHLRNRFAHEQIYLMAHSGGTFIGVQAACRAPDRYAAYVGVAQMVHRLESEEEAYAYLLNRFERSEETAGWWAGSDRPRSRGWAARLRPIWRCGIRRCTDSASARPGT